MVREFKSKVVGWLVAVIVGVTAISILPIMIFDFSWLLVGLMAAILIFALYALYSISYTISGDTLTVKCGVFSKGMYRIQDISRIKNTDSILASPAASMDRIAIYFHGQKDPLIISPKAKTGFIQYLKEINPDIQYS